MTNVGGHRGVRRDLSRRRSGRDVHERRARRRCHRTSPRPTRSSGRPRSTIDQRARSATSYYPIGVQADAPRRSVRFADDRRRSRPTTRRRSGRRRRRRTPPVTAPKPHDSATDDRARTVSLDELEALLLVQEHDITLDQLRHRRGALPERAELDGVRRARRASAKRERAEVQRAPRRGARRGAPARRRSASLGRARRRSQQAAVLGQPRVAA